MLLLAPARSPLERWVETHLPRLLARRKVRYLAPENDPLVRTGTQIVADGKRYSAKRTLKGKTKTPVHTLIEWSLLLTVALVITSLVRSTLVQTFHIPSESMVPTLLVGDRVAVNKIAFDLGEPRRGQVVVFRAPAALRSEERAAGTAPTEYLVKRIIGLPGERVTGRGGRIWINNRPLDESYLPAGTTTSAFTVHLGSHLYWMMGDNREFSKDSRFFGPVRDTSMTGTVLVRFWPLARIGRPK